MSKKVHYKILRCFTNHERLFFGFLGDYSLLVSETKRETTKAEGQKILTPKQMPQRLPIALAQVTADNNLKNLLKKIRQIVYSLYQ